MDPVDVPGDQQAQQVQPGEPFGHGGHQPAGQQPPAHQKGHPAGPVPCPPDYGNRLTASRIAAELAPKARLQAGTARTYLYAELNGSKS